MKRISTLLFSLAGLLIVVVGAARAGNNGGSALNIGYDAGYEYVLIGNYYNYTNAITIEAWVRPAPTQPSDYPRIVDKYDWGGHKGYSLNIINDHNPTYQGRVHFEMYTSNGVIHHLHGPVLLGSFNRWHHVAVTYDGTYARMYVDGKLEGVRNMGGPMSTNGIGMRFGNSWDNHQYRGGLDEVRIWNVARTQAEIQADMFRELQGTEPHLTGYWKFNEGSGTTVTDATGNHNGVLVNTEAGDWVASTVPLGDATVSAQKDVAALWASVNPASSAGLTLSDNATTPFLQDTGDDVLFGHDGGTGNTNLDLPTGGAWDTAPNPARWGRVWYCDLNDQNGNGGTLDVTFDFNAAGMGAYTPTAPASNYRLLERVGTSGAFSDIATATSVDSTAKTVTFSGVSVGTMCSYVTLGTLDNITSPTAVRLQDFRAHSASSGIVLVMIAGILFAGAMLWARRLWLSRGNAA